MESGFFSTVFYKPLYNTLVLILAAVPGANVGVAIIILTVVVRSVLLPLSHKSVVSQAKMRSLAPHLEKLKEKHKDNKQEQARKTMELYKEHGINPFSGCLLVLIQLPVIFALYFVFFKGLPNLNPEHLYSFVHVPSVVSMMFLGIILSKKSIILALLAAITQYYQIKLSIPPMAPAEKGAKPSFKDDFARSFNVQMRYMLPVIVFGISYSISAAVALYWTTSNLFSIGHELYVKRKAEAIKG
ncbi:YidC/Oxa1 family membrane protein insertase [Patescibacteria group bacterium]|nr:MAG: YidC/Oxa1 family membrane protein insertase [Patescibacteria group bacterium]